MPDRSPHLCPFHREVLAMALRHEHINENHIRHNLDTIAGQCTECDSPNGRTQL